MLRWAAQVDIDPHFIEPGRPMQNGSVESFNGRLRDELSTTTPSQRFFTHARRGKNPSALINTRLKQR